MIMQTKYVVLRFCWVRCWLYLFAVANKIVRCRQMINHFHSTPMRYEPPIIPLSVTNALGDLFLDNLPPEVHPWQDTPVHHQDCEYEGNLYRHNHAFLPASNSLKPPPEGDCVLCLCLVSWKLWTLILVDPFRTMRYTVCVRNLVIIGSGNGLAPVRCQAITWTNANLMPHGPSGTKLRLTFNQNTFYKTIVWKISAKWDRAAFCSSQYIKHPHMPRANLLTYLEPDWVVNFTYRFWDSLVCRKVKHIEIGEHWTTFEGKK